LTPEPSIIFQSANWIIINKPSGWHTVRPRRPRGWPSPRSPQPSPCQHNAPNDAPTVEQWVIQQNLTAPDLPEAGILHRLDQQTSGCLLIAKTLEAWDTLKTIVRTGSDVRKTYLAVIPPGLEPTTGRFSFYFTSRYRRSKKVTVFDTGEARHRGVCDWRIIQQNISPDTRADLVEIKIIGPGRRHQIRAGLAHLGFPIHGDERYGGIAPWAGGFGLHAWKLCIRNQDEVIAPIPVDWPVTPSFR